MRRFILAALVVAGLTAGDAAASPRAVVSSAAGVHAAADRMRASGGIIVLRAGRYPNLAIGARPRGAPWLTLRGRPGARVGHLSIVRANHVRVMTLRLRPAGRDALLHVRYSRHVKVDRVGITAAGTPHVARVSLAGARHVTFIRTSWTRCGENREACLTLGWRSTASSYVRILDSRFHDCYGCDFLRGHIGTGLLIRRVVFERAVPGPCGTGWSCNHQDAIQLGAGRGIVVEDSRFGLTFQGAGQMYLSGATDRVTIRNNVFVGTDPAFPQYVGWAAIVLGHHRTDEPAVPTRVKIANNTILTGSPRPDGWNNSVFATPSYANFPIELRPVVANNVLGITGTPERLCPYLQLSTRNVVREGTICAEADLLADPMLDERGFPLEGSPVIGAADPAYAPALDKDGVVRGETPAIGAYEAAR